MGLFTTFYLRLQLDLSFIGAKVHELFSKPNMRYA